MSQTAWILDKKYDLLFFSPLWWFPACLILFYSGLHVVGIGTIFIGYHLLIRIPHFVATYPVTYFNSENYSYYFSHKFQFFFVPIGILVVYCLYGDWGSDGSISESLSVVSLFWGLQHISFQNFGILQIYSRRIESHHARLRLFEKLSYFCLFLGSALLVLKDRKFLVPNNWSGYVWTLAMIFYFFLMCFFLVCLWIRVRDGIPKNLAGINFFIFSVFSLVYWPFYTVLWGSFASAFFFYMNNGQHGLSYLGLIFYMLEKKRENKKTESVENRKIRFVFFYVLLVIVSAAVIGVSYFMNTSLFEASASQYRLFGVLEGFFVLHYYLESISWKYRVPHFRRVSFSLIEPLRD